MPSKYRMTKADVKAFEALVNRIHTEDMLEIVPAWIDGEDGTKYPWQVRVYSYGGGDRFNSGKTFAAAVRRAALEAAR